MSLNYVTLILDLFDGQGNAVSQGWATLTASATLTDTADNEIVAQAPVAAQFRNGLPAQVSLLATDNGALAPSGWGWTISYTGVPGNPPGFSFFLPFSGGATQHLSHLSPVSSVVTMQAYMPLPSGTPTSGQVPVATGAGEGSAWGTVSGGGGMANPMTTLGDMIIENAAPAAARLPGDTSNTRKFLRTQAAGGVAQLPAWDTLQAGDVPVLNQNTTGTAAGLSATLPIGSGGTGQVTQQAAINALTGAQSSGKVLRSDGVNAALANIQAADVPVLNQNTTGTAAGLSATLAIGSGGTGQATAAAAYNALSPMTTTGDIEYESGASTASRLAGNTSATKNFLTQTGTGSVSAAPAWGTIAAADLPTGTTSTKGALQLDGTAADITRPGLQAAGANGKAADAAHVHPFDTWQPSDQGLLTWNADPGITGTAGAALTSAGTLFVMAVKLSAAASITNIVMFLSSNGTTLTAGQCFAALYQGAGGALIGTTADQAAGWGAGAPKLVTMPLSGGPFAASAGILYVAVWWNGTTGPAFSRYENNASKSNAGLAAASSRWGTADTGRTTTGPATLGTISAAGTGLWVALS